MSITYEEALATLEAMFGEPWTRETLDAVLRHEKGHMENTCERILGHGSKDPQILVDRLKEGGPEPQLAMDEELARQLAAQEQRGGRTRAAASKKKNRGTPTVLPDDFLRIPGFKRTSTAAAASGAVDDETLARMLQDELFAEELARNPDFAHLARGRRAATRSNPHPGQRRSGAASAGQPNNPFEGVNVMDKISELGEGARRQLRLFATNFEQKIKDINKGAGGQQKVGLVEDANAAAERRGLLDEEDEDMIEFETRKNQ